MFEFYINGNKLSQIPDGWDSIVSSIKRDDATGILLYDSANDFKFYAGQAGFTILKAAWDANKYGESTIDIYQRYPDGTYILIHSGTIFHSSIKFELINNNLSFKTEDRGFYATINNNKQIETALNTGKTKNDVIIPPCPSFTLNVHRIDNGNLRHQCVAYKVIDVIRYLVNFMTDSRMTVDAPCFDSGGEFENLCIVNGHELAKHDQKKYPIISWQTLSTDLVKRLNVQFAITGSLDAPVMKVDSYNNFFDQNFALEIPSIPNEVKLETDENILYSMVDVGSEKTDTTSTLVFPDVYSLSSFRQESFHFKGTNNIDRKLDLVGKLIVSHAVIEVITENKSGWDSYEDDVCLLQYKLSNNWTNDTNWVGSVAANKHLFNEMFTNQNILNRWSGSLPADISNTVFNPTANQFTAYCDSPPGINGYNEANVTPNTFHHEDYAQANTVIDEIPFWNDYRVTFDPTKTGMDPNNNFGGGNIITPQGTSVKFPNLYYSAPTNGFFTFNASVYLNVWYGRNTSNKRWADKKFRIRFIKTDSSGSEIDHHDGPLFNLVDDWSKHNQWNQQFWLSNTWGTFMNSGERMRCVIYSNVEKVTPNNDQKWYTIQAKQGYFSCSGINTGGGNLIPSNPDNYKSMKITFDYPLQLDDYDVLRNSKQGLVTVPIGDNVYIKGWINTIKFQHNSGETNFILRTDGNTIYQ